MRRLLRFLGRLLGIYKKKCPWCGVRDVPVPVYDGDIFLGQRVALNPYYIHYKCFHCGLIFNAELIKLKGTNTMYEYCVRNVWR